MADEKVVIEVQVTGDGQAVAALNRVNQAVNKAEDQGRKAGDGLSHMERAMMKASTVGTMLGNALYDVGARVVSGLIGTIGQAISSAAKMQTTMAGLASVAGAFGIGADAAKQAAIGLSKDGLMKVDEAASGLKNLLQTGFSLPESIKLMQVFKDSAAFGAQGFYSVGQASVRATEGIKFGNSALTDSTGLGKNLSVIMREAGLSETMAGQAASNHAVRRAILNGFIKEGELFTGQAEVKSRTFAGQQERLSNTYDVLLASLGSYIVENKSVVALLEVLGTKLTDLMNWLAEAGRGYDFVTSAIGVFLTAIDKMLWAVDMAIRAWHFMQDGINGLVAGFTGVGKAIIGFQLDMLKAVASVPGATTVIGGLEEGITRLQSTYDLASSATYTYTKASKDAEKAWKEGNPAIQAMRSSVQAMSKSVEAARGQTVEFGKAKERDTKATQDNGKAHGKSKADIDQYKKGLADLNTEVKAAISRGAEMKDIVKKYGDQAVKAADDSKFFKVNIEQAAGAVKKLADETKKLELAKTISEAMKQAAGDAKSGADAIFAAMRASVATEMDRINQAMVANHAAVKAAQDKATEERKKASLDETQFKVWQLQQEEAAVIASLDTKDAKYRDHVAAIKGYYGELVDGLVNTQTATKDWGDSLERIVGLMSQIAQATNSQVLKDLVGTLGTFAIANRAKTEYGSNWGIGGALVQTKFDGTRDINWENTAAAGVGLTTGAMNVWGATDVAGRGNRAMAGAKAGAAAGAMFGPYGALIGMGVGALVGALRNPGFEQEMKRIANDFGVNISEKLAREIDKLRKSFGGDRVAAEIFSLDKIITEAGGVNDKNSDKLIARFRDIFVMLETGKFTAEQAQATIEKSFPAYADYMAKSTKVAGSNFTELFTLSQRFGIESAKMTEFLMGQTERVGDSLTGLIQPLATQYAGLGDKIKALTADYDGMVAAGTISADEAKRAQAELAQLTTLQAEGAANAKAELEDLGLIALGTYNAARNAGLGEVEAIGQISGALGALTQTYTDLGLEVENEAVAALMAYAQKIEANKNLVEQASLLNETMLATSNIGALNQETFDAMQRQGVRTYDRLRAAGFSENETLTIMRDYLDQVANAHKELGLEVDETTAGYIAQANAAGIMKTAQQELNDIMKDGLGAIIELLGGKLPDAWQTASKAAEDGTKQTSDGLESATRRARELADAARRAGDEVAGIGSPNGGDYERVHTGGYLGNRGKVIYRYHWGGVAGMKPDEVPAILQTGEGVINRKGMKNLGIGGLHALNRGGSIGGGGGGSVTINAPITIEGDVKDEATVERLAKEVGDRIAKQLRKRRIA